MRGGCEGRGGVGGVREVGGEEEGGVGGHELGVGVEEME